MNEPSDPPELADIFDRIRQVAQPHRLEVVDGPIIRSRGWHARALHEAHLRIGRHFDAGLFGDPAFDILLHLYASEEEGRRTSVGDCSVAARKPSSTTLRHIAALEAQGLVCRRKDHHDDRRVLISLTPDGKSRMIAYLEGAPRRPDRNSGAMTERP